jgi:predicted class III extradiol MEMO1 family dioxygenase
MKIRKADFAGNWYPGSASGCEKEINKFLKEKFIPYLWVAAQ